MAGGVVLGIPASILQLVQTGLLERAFHDSLFPSTIYRQEAMAEEWGAHAGSQIFMGRAGLLAPIVTPGTPGQDPSPQTLSYEQWVANLNRYYGTIDTHMPTNILSNADQFLRNIQQLGLQAGQSINRIARNNIFVPYLSGQTLTTQSQVAGDTSIAVASVNGFTTVVLPGSQVRPVPVSSANPLPIKIVGVAANSVVGFQLSNPADPNGPGTLLLSAAIGGAGITARTTVTAQYAPTVVRSGGGNSVDAITSGDTLTLQDIINAVAQLRTNNVQPHEDGFFHAHISPNMNAEMFSDPVFQRLYTALPEAAAYKQGFIGAIQGVAFYMNPESPTVQTVSATTATGTNALYAYDIGAEVVDNAGIPINRTLITGKGALLEKWLNESAYISEAGVNGKVGEFDVVNNGLQITTDRIRLVLRAPIDRLQDVVSATWSITTSFPVPSDLTAQTSNALFKRAVIVESA